MKYSAVCGGNHVNVRSGRGDGIIAIEVRHPDVVFVKPFTGRYGSFRDSNDLAKLDDLASRSDCRDGHFVTLWHTGQGRDTGNQGAFVDMINGHNEIVGGVEPDGSRL